MQKLSAWGVQAELPPATQTLLKPETDAIISAPSVGDVASTTPLPPADSILSESDDRIRAQIDREVSDPEQKLAWAVRLASIYELIADNERNYRRIFGSQLALLKGLNTVPSLTEPLIQPNYGNYLVATINQPSRMHYGDWLSFLITNQLASITKVNDVDSVSITERGRRFLRWIVTNRLPEQHPF